MSAFLALYAKEIKDQKGWFLVLLAGTVGLYALVYSRVQTRIVASFLCGVPVWGFVFILPFMLAHAFSSEWRSNTNYLVLSMPVRTSAVGFCKYLAVLSMGTLLALVSVAGTVLVVGRPEAAGAPQLASVFGLTSRDVMSYVVVVYFSILFLLLGIVTGMEAAKFSVQRYRGLAAAGFFLLSLYAYKSFMGAFTGLLRPHLGVGAALAVYTVFCGVAFLGVGLFLFEKKVEI